MNTKDFVGTPSFSDKKILSVVMPVYNEQETLSSIVKQVLHISDLLELIIVDDCSNDNTPQIAQTLIGQDERIRYVRQKKNGGKTEALKTGFSMTKGEIVIVQDADLEYDPADIAGVIAPIIEGHADVVYGSRFMVKRATRVVYFYHYLANKGLTFLSNIVTNLNMSDVETCYKAFRGDIIRNMVITSRGFGFEIEVTAKIAKLKCPVYEVPISYYGRTYEEGKKIGFKDGVAAFWYILKYNFFVNLSKSYSKIPQTISSPKHSLLIKSNE